MRHAGSSRQPKQQPTSALPLPRNRRLPAKLRALLLVALLPLLLFVGGCSGLLGSGANGSAIATDASVLERVPRVEAWSKSPCWQQKQIAKQETFIRSTLAKRDVVVYAACIEHPPTVPMPQPSPAPVPTAQPRTS